MNTNTMELTLNDMELVTGGDAMDHFWGAVDGVIFGASGGTFSGLAVAGPVGGAIGFLGGAVVGGVAGGIVGEKSIKNFFVGLFSRK